MDVDDDSNTIIESNEDETEFETNNVMTVTKPVKLEIISSCATILKKTKKQEYNDIRKEVNSSVHQKDLIPSYYHLDKKYSVFIGGTYENDNNKNKDDTLHSSSDINHDFHEK